MERAKILGSCGVKESLAVLRAASQEKESWFRKASHICLKSVFSIVCLCLIAEDAC